MPAIKIDGLVFPMAVVSSGTNTSDATATAADILVGKTAYIATGKVVGIRPLTAPYVLFISNDQTYNGSYIATGSIFNNAPVYELT